MRIRTIALLSLLVPAGLSAQVFRLPRIGTRPSPPVPVPKQPVPIANALAYQRSKVSSESYPVASWQSAPGIVGGQSFGMGTRIDYRLNYRWSLTGDMTASLFGGPTQFATFEFGTRYSPERRERRWDPFFDMRAGYIVSLDYVLPPGQAVGAASGPQYVSGTRYSTGFGAIAGGGVEIGLTPAWSLTTAANVMQSHMTPHEFMYNTSASPYNATTIRLILGLRYNRVRFITDPPQQ